MMLKAIQQEVLQQLEPMFKQILDQPDLCLTRFSSAMNTLNWDSLAQMEIFEAVERYFRVRFELCELQETKDVGDLVDLIVLKIHER
jgi:acyl carrier protein